MGVKSITKHLNTVGIRTRDGGRWGIDAVQSIKAFARTARERMRIEGGGYRRDYRRKRFSPFTHNGRSSRGHRLYRVGHAARRDADLQRNKAEARLRRRAGSLVPFQELAKQHLRTGGVRDRLVDQESLKLRLFGFSGLGRG